MLLWTIDLLPHPAQEWTTDGDWNRTESRQYVDGGDRVAVLLTADVTEAVWVEVRSMDDSGFPGPWLAAEEVWRGGDAQRLLTTDLDWTPGAQVRVLGEAEAVGWGLHVVEHRGSAAPPSALSSTLTDIGVVSRTTWGADATTCTTPENDWYRFAIHHTAGNQTGSGTVQGAVQSLQAYAMGSGGYCDIPYQFLVGYDGSLWEGRPLTLYSGATGAGNNDGNIAISYLGCYDSDGCGDDGGDDLPLVMHAAARHLVQTLAVEHGITTTHDTLRGHRDWPDAATACPGDRVHDRIEELMSPAAHYAGALVASTWGDRITIPQGQSVGVTLTLRNDGLYAWDDDTLLAPLPRDADHALWDASWQSGSRIVATGAVAPGETVEVPILLYGTQVGESTLELTLVQEWVTWFADAPIGGGPDALTVTVEVVPEDALPDDSGEPPDSGPAVSYIGPPGEAVALGRGCTVGPRGGGGLLALLPLLWIRRR
ncbi:MAG: hypothetical protein ACI8RZ_000736 [Myxococcota bacterium]|jgi:hypothetical protein